MSVEIVYDMDYWITLTNTVTSSPADSAIARLAYVAPKGTAWYIPTGVEAAKIALFVTPSLTVTVPVVVLLTEIPQRYTAPNVVVAEPVSFFGFVSFPICFK